MSNLPENPDSGLRRGGEIHVRRAAKSDTNAALRLVLGCGGQPASDEQVVDFMRFAVYRGIDLSDIWIAERGGQLLWAILPVASPGRTMVLFVPPHVAPTLAQTVAPELIERVLGEVRTEDVQLAQVLVDPGDASVLSLFDSAGFARLARLVYMNRDLKRSDSQRVESSGGMGLLTYSKENHALFARTIMETYEGSLDCPGLNGRRSIEDIIAGHQAVGQFDPSLWLALHDGNRAHGVALVNRSPHSEQGELVYLGLVRSARGRGLGDLLLRHALCAAMNANARTVTLAVDAANFPAIHLYTRHRFGEVCSRIAMLRDLREASKTNRGIGAGALQIAPGALGGDADPSVTRFRPL